MMHSLKVRKEEIIDIMTKHTALKDAALWEKVL